MRKKIRIWHNTNIRSVVNSSVDREIVQRDLERLELRSGNKELAHLGENIQKHKYSAGGRNAERTYAERDFSMKGQIRYEFAMQNGRGGH